MSTKTVRVRKPGEDPGTPVIIKSGGGDYLSELRAGDNLPEPQTPVEIDSPIPFHETVREGTKWEASKSTESGRLMAFTITDGGVEISCNIPNPSSELASITIKYGSYQLIARESRGEKDKVFLVIESPEILFSGPASEDWRRSVATFPHLMHSVTMMVGAQQQLYHECHNSSVEVGINFQSI